MSNVNTNTMRDSKLYEEEIKQHASGLTTRELNQLIDKLLDRGQYEEASMYAKVYVRRKR